MGLQCMSPITENKTVLSDFKNFEIKDKPLIDSFTKPWKLDCSDLSFANMFIWGADGKFQYTIYEDVLYIKLNFQTVPEFSGRRYRDTALILIIKSLWIMFMIISEEKIFRL